MSYNTEIFTLSLQISFERVAALAGSWIRKVMGYSPDRALTRHEEPPFAAHLVSPRGLYAHHGIYVGAGRVIHYSGLVSGFRPGPVEEVPLADFARGHVVRVRSERWSFEGNEIVQRAQARLGENRYHLFRNNCKHFCMWCLYGNRGIHIGPSLSSLRR